VRASDCAERRPATMACRKEENVIGLLDRKL
jgi:hypothetical protein